MPIGEPRAGVSGTPARGARRPGRINAKNEPDVSVQRRVIFSAGA